MAAMEPWVEQRAGALATVVLMRHAAVAVSPASRFAGYDLDVRVGKGGTSARIFGVELKARASLPRVGRFVGGDCLRLSYELRRALEKQQAHVADLQVPLLFIVFEMESDRGFYGWLREPVLGRARALRSPGIELAREWGPKTHEEIVDLVNQWYDAAPTHARRTG